MALLICRTCPRYDTRHSGGFSREIADALAGEPDAAGLRVRFVPCLGGCPDHGVLAVDAPGKARVRFTGLTVDHVPAAVAAARAHDTCPTGEPGDWDVPAELADHLSSVTPARRPGPGAPWLESPRPDAPGRPPQPRDEAAGHEHPLA